MIENIEIMLKYNNLSVDEIFNSLSASGNFNLLCFVKEINKRIGLGGEYEKVYNEVMSDFYFTKSYDNEDRDLIKGFLSLLGKSDINGQIANCKMYKEFFKSKLLLLENNENDKCKSFAALIVGAGIMTSILLI